MTELEPKNLPPLADGIGRICGRGIEVLQFLGHGLDACSVRSPIVWL